MNAASASIASASIAFVGGGNMARSLIGALLRAGRDAADIRVAEPNADVRARLAADFAVAVHERAEDAAANAQVLLLAVKPQVMREVCASVAAAVAATRPLTISIAAGIRIAQLREWLAVDVPLVRAMPNTPALIGAGATGLFANATADSADRARAEAIFAAAGSAVWIGDEHLMDTVTAVSGSGPAYFFLLVEALEDAAVAQGLPRDTARALAAQTCLGAGRMLVEDGAPPGVLRERVTSPNGTTAAALDAFNEGGLRELVARAVDAAAARGRALSGTLS